MSSPEPIDVGPKFGGDIRISDADRDQVMAVLSAAYAEGRITTDEHHERLAAASSARTFDDLIPLTRDLVPVHAPIRPNVPAEQPPGVSLPEIDRRSTGDSETLVAVFGGSTRRGVWRARRQINTIALFGGNELDFTEAIFENDVIQVNGFWMFGGCEIKLPEGVEVRDQVVGIFGGSDVKYTRPAPGGPTIIIKGLALFGGVTVKGPKAKRR